MDSFALQVAAVQLFTLRVRCRGSVLELLHLIAKQRGPPALAQLETRLTSVPCGSPSTVQPHVLMLMASEKLPWIEGALTSCLCWQSVPEIS
jgi:hypothetical protein